MLWKVPIQRLRASCSPTSCPIRAFISRAALLVKVRDKMETDPLLLHQVCDSVGQHPCFARTGSRDDHHGAIDVPCSFALGVVQVVEKIHPSKVRSGA